jgi:hypothetical protein
VACAKAAKNDRPSTDFFCEVLDGILNVLNLVKPKGQEVGLLE